MATLLTPGQRTWKASFDDNGYGDYKITYRVTADVWDGPTNVLLTPGLPLYGSWWIVDGDVNLWAWRRWNAEVEPDVQDEPNTDWSVTYTFSTRPVSPKDGDRPASPDQPGDPRLEPTKVTGSFIRYAQEATHDRFGNPITNSAFEVMRGHQVEFDRNRLQIKLEFNVANLPLNYLIAMADTVNAYPLWGIPPRCVKLSDPDFELKFFGQQTYYWTVRLTFDIDFGTWDRNLLDEGTKCLHGTWDNAPGGTGQWKLLPVGTDSLGHPIPPDPYNPQHYSRFKDRNGENCRVVLNGSGMPAGVLTGGGSVSGTTNYAYMYTGDIPSNPGPPPGGSWLQVTGPPADKVSNWTPGTIYRAGALVAYKTALMTAPEIYLCTSTTGTISVPGAAGWQLVPQDTVPNNRGAWASPAIYSRGDIVTSSATVTINIPYTNTGPPGNIHVEKYAESDFSLLGVPLVLPNIY